MSLVINTSPNLDFGLSFEYGEIDLDANMTLDQLAEQDGRRWITGAATREFDREMLWAVGEFIKRKEQLGYVYSSAWGLPPGMKQAWLAKGPNFAVYRDSILVTGPYYPLDYTSNWPTHPEDGEEISRPWPTSLEATKGRVAYRLGCYMAVKQRVLQRMVEYAKEPELYRAVRNAKKVNGLWQPQPAPAKKHFPMEASRDN